MAAGAEKRRRPITGAVGRADAGPSRIEQAERFAVAREPFTVENATMTPTLNIRRREAPKRYGAARAALYARAARENSSA